jgi:dihydroorotase
MKLLIKNGRVIDPSEALDGERDILLEGARIRGVYQTGRAPGADRVIDAKGRIVVPGLVDMHTHLRDPGFEYKETIASGTMAAVRGGYTTVCCMPNTSPVNDDVSVTDYILRKAQEEGSCAVYPVGALTKGSRGEELSEFGVLTEAGCVAFSDDGRPVMNSLIMRRVLEYSRIFNVPVISHCEDTDLSDGGVMNESLTSTVLGLKGIPAAAEEVMVARDIALCELTGGRLHVAHVSTGGSVSLIREAKSRGIRVTAETCPHYFSITEEALKAYDTNCKVNPPLRTEKDVSAIKQGLKDGTIDAIATDHAPHHDDDKNREFDTAAFGISGLETAFSLALRLVEEKVLDLSGLIVRMAVAPSEIMGISKGTLRKGADADIAIIDTEQKFTVDSSKFLSGGKNSAFNGWPLKGSVMATISMGKVHEWK